MESLHPERLVFYSVDTILIDIQPFRKTGRVCVCVGKQCLKLTCVFQVGTHSTEADQKHKDSDLERD